MTAAAICGLALIDSGYLLLTSLQILDRFLKPLASRLDRRPADKPAARIRRARSEQPELEKTPTVRKLRAFEIRGRYVKRQRRWLMNDQGPGIWFAGEAEITRKWLLGAGLVRLRPTTGFLSLPILWIVLTDLAYIVLSRRPATAGFFIGGRILGRCWADRWLMNTKLY